MGSLRGWRAVFPFANITGLDLDTLAVEQARGPRIRTQVCNSMDATQVQDTFEGTAPFDMIIDDGAHRHDAQWQTLRNLWRYLRDGGLYIVEDVATVDGAKAMANDVDG